MSENTANNCLGLIMVALIVLLLSNIAWAISVYEIVRATH